MKNKKNSNPGSTCPNNIWQGDNLRVTFITSRLIRFEWSEDGIFEDRRTLAVFNRNCGKVDFTQKRCQDGHIELKTEYVTVKLADNGRKLTARNCEASFRLGTRKQTWHAGAADTGNLLGTTRTLDCCDGDIRFEGEEASKHFLNPESDGIGIRQQLGAGFISRDGWSCIDDSANVVLNETADGPWVAPRSDADRQDFYLLFYGHEYRAALQDAARVFGSQPLPPRYAFGYWFSRYWAYSDTEIEQMADIFDRYDLPLDVMVVDMDWHLVGWTGYTWDKRYFPDPDNYLKEIHRRGLRTTLNLHPADGVGKHEAQFTAMAKAMGLDPRKTDRVPFDITDPKFMKLYFELLHHPEEKRGVDFWWLDWQQGETTPMKGLDTLPWLNHLHWEDMRQNHKERPLIFSRFGGPGAGRYAIGFSGDTYSTWKSLQYQPYFTATAANILYGYWSHDIGGHMPGKTNPEIYLRWLQFGAFSPILRTHTTKNPDAERRVFAYAEPYGSLMMDAIKRRYEIVPYLYTEARKCCDSAVSLVHPLYYDFPEDQEVYKDKNSYMFGDKMIVSPVTSPIDQETGLAEQKFYLPEGNWYDTTHGEMLRGGKWHTRHYALQEIPVFVRPGTVIPETRNLHRLNGKSWETLVMTVYPGPTGEYQLYEDDGISQKYLTGQSAVTEMRQQLAGRKQTVEIHHLSGEYQGWTDERDLTIRLVGAVPPSAVKIGRLSLPCVFRDSEASGKAYYRYDGDTATVIIACGTISLSKGVKITVEYDTDDPFSAADGNRLKMTRIALANVRHKVMPPQGIPDGDERLCQDLAQTGHRIAMHPETFAEEWRAFDKKLKQLQNIFKKSTNEAPQVQAVKTLLEIKA